MQVTFTFDETDIEPDQLIDKNEVGLVVAFAAIITCFFLEGFGAARIMNAKLKLDKIVDETRAELFQTVDEMIRLRQSLEFHQDMNVLIKAMRPVMHETDDTDDFVSIMVALTGRTYTQHEVRISTSLNVAKSWYSPSC